METRVTHLTDHLRTPAHGCLSVMSPQHLEAISRPCADLISHSPVSGARLDLSSVTLILESSHPNT